MKREGRRSRSVLVRLIARQLAETLLELEE